MQPFTSKTIEIIAISLISYFVSYTLFKNISGLWGITGRSIVFISLYSVGVYYRKISPDVMPIINNLKKRMGIKEQTVN
jgi:hypothetical protein